MPACEGFLLTPAQDGRPAQVMLRMKPASSRANTFIALNRELEKHKQLYRKLEASREQLRLSEENLAITLKSIGDAVMVTDRAGNLVSLNPVAERLTGWSNDE
ncbi:MAG TPA: PAS domain S-box protein, partial [Thiotrichales bacterium]|nr:PAS domain S-box protein [Thiotrichales bacterium]